MCSLGTVGMAAINSIIFAFLEVHPINPDLILVSVLINVVVEVQDVVT